MPFGRGFGRGFGWGFSPYGYGAYPFGGWGGRGNPFSFCRNFPWLPRWWWATPYAGQYASTIPYYGYGYPTYGMGYGMGYPYYGMGYPGFNPLGYPGTQAPPTAPSTVNQ